MIVGTYILYALVGTIVFARWRGPGAAACCLVIGWAALPAMDFVAAGAALSPGGQPMDAFNLRGVALPQPVFITKASVIGAVVGFGMLAFDPSRLARLRFRWFDLPIVTWCGIPLVSGVAADAGLMTGLANSVYQALAWGVPYVAGRAYFASAGGLIIFGKTLVLTGLAYAPLCLFEIVASPRLYSWLYGDHPHQVEGAARTVGWRPVVLTEHGNALGMWMAVSALVGWGLWRSGWLSGWNRAARWVAGLGLAAVTVACQAVGPIVLLVLGVAALHWARRIRWWMLAIAVVLPISGYIGLRLANVEAKPIIRRVFGESMIDQLKQLPRGPSIGWRIRREEEHMPRVTERLVFGHGTWDWWRGPYDAPWSLWMLTVGMYGLVGLVGLLGCLGTPIACLLTRLPPPTWLEPGVVPFAIFAIVLAATLADGMLNSTFAVALFAGAGALSGGAIEGDGPRHG